MSLFAQAIYSNGTEQKLRTGKLRELDPPNANRDHRPSARNDSCRFRPFHRWLVKTVLLPIGDAAEVLDTYYPLFRLREEGFRVLVAGPERRPYHLVLHERPE